MSDTQYYRRGGRFTLSQITPLTYRDGETYVSLLWRLFTHIREELHPSLEKSFDQLIFQLEDEMDKAHQQFVDGVEEFQRIHDAFMEDVEASLRALNDTVVADLVSDEDTYLGVVLRELFVQHVTLDGDIADLLRDDTSQLYTVFQTVLEPVFDELENTVKPIADTINDGRLSAGQLAQDFDTRSRVNTKTFDGTGLERLMAAIDTGEPVQFDETVDHDGNIPSFWDRNIYGSGVINLPGGATFTVEPNTTTSTIPVNTVYVRQSDGKDTNDGLTPDTAFDTVSTAYRTVLKRLSTQQRNGAKWVVRIMGRHVDGVTRFYDLGEFPNGLVFQGDEPKGDGRPTTTMEKGSTTSSRPLWFEPCPKTVEIYNIHFKGWNDSYGYGIYARYNGRIVVEECEFSDCMYGFAAIQNMTFRFVNNWSNPGTRTAGMAQYNSTGQFNKNEFIGSKDADRYGVRITRNTIVHVDDNTFNNYGEAGVYVDMASRASVNRNSFSNNVSGVTVTGSAEWTNNDNTFYKDNRVAYQHHGGGKEMRMHAVGSWTGSEYRVGSTNSQYGTSQGFDLNGWTTIYRGFYAGRIPAQWFQSQQKWIHVVMHGHTDSGGVKIDVGSDPEGSTAYDSFCEVTLPDSGYFTLEAFIYSTAVSSQRSFIKVVAGDEARSTSATSSVDMSKRRHMRVRGYGSGQRLVTYNMQTFFMG